MTAVPQPRPAEESAPTPAETQAPAQDPTPAPDPTPIPATAPAVAEPTAPARAAGRRSLAAALLLGVAGAAVVLLAAGKTWAHGIARSSDGSLPIDVSGNEVTSVPGALALVGLAALVAVFAVRRTGRVVVSGLLALCGAGIVIASLAGGDTAALDAAATAATHLSSTSAVGKGSTGWPLAAAAGGVLLLAAGALALLRSRHWPGMSNRYDRDGATGLPARKAQRAAPDPERPEELWKALDRGEDPTRG
ncbi:TIGR02234 family membrane protein [Streptomyces sp. H10-C2]|uniref:TIGR02234 family membrane protein n=1 Tax=Streptomyces sp. H10-C2 TaxID=3046210 RepID=UPI0024B8C06A|nr:TIGR02234 family membrane protein [Streptomyces sp. H10-C2]MDJ0369616.1 TIGR02234 family membrane protein [Streptomyces sp. H10-C2]